MSTLFTALLLGYAALALQSTLVHSVRIGGAAPDLPLVAVVIVGATRGSALGALLGFIVGLGQDLGNPEWLGLNALCKSCLGYGLGRMRAHTDAAHWATYALMLFAAKLAHDVVYLLFYTRLALSELAVLLAQQTFPSAVYTAALGMWIFGLFVSASGRKGHRFGRSPFAGR